MCVCAKPKTINSPFKFELPHEVFPKFPFQSCLFLKFLSLVLRRHIPLYPFSNFLFFPIWLWVFSWILTRIQYLEERCYSAFIESQTFYSVKQKTSLKNNCALYLWVWKMLEELLLCSNGSKGLVRKYHKWIWALSRERWMSSFIRSKRASGYMSHVPRICEVAKGIQ